MINLNRVGTLRIPQGEDTYNEQTREWEKPALVDKKIWFDFLKKEEYVQFYPEGGYQPLTIDIITRYDKSLVNTTLFKDYFKFRYNGIKYTLRSVEEHFDEGRNRYLKLHLVKSKNQT